MRHDEDGLMGCMSDVIVLIWMLFKLMIHGVLLGAFIYVAVAVYQLLVQ
jgi:hypothetical protein